MESIFGGLDKIYKAHHLLGQITFLVIFFHPLFLILRSIYNFDLILLYIIPGKNMPYTYGIISFLLLIILLVLTLILRLPYKIWHLSHKFMGITLILATWHAVTSGSAINQYQILRVSSY
jgi:predicted ferric reductase